MRKNTENRGLAFSWFESLEPYLPLLGGSSDSNQGRNKGERFLILEDDILLSKYWFRYLHAAAGKYLGDKYKAHVGGISLQLCDGASGGVHN